MIIQIFFFILSLFLILLVNWKENKRLRSKIRNVEEIASLGRDTAKYNNVFLSLQILGFRFSKKVISKETGILYILRGIEDNGDMIRVEIIENEKPSGFFRKVSTKYFLDYFDPF